MEGGWAVFHQGQPLNDGKGTLADAFALAAREKVRLSARVWSAKKLRFLTLKEAREDGSTTTRALCAIVLGLSGLLSLTMCDLDAKEKPKPAHNYILRRQEAHQVRGVPVRSIYSHGRRIDVYRDGRAFEKDGRAN
jgi:hypothetical protein